MTSLETEQSLDLIFYHHRTQRNYSNYHPIFNFRYHKLHKVITGKNVTKLFTITLKVRGEHSCPPWYSTLKPAHKEIIETFIGNSNSSTIPALIELLQGEIGVSRTDAAGFLDWWFRNVFLLFTLPNFCFCFQRH